MLDGAGDQPVRKRQGDIQHGRDFPEFGVTETVHFKGDAGALGQFLQGRQDMRVFFFMKRDGLRTRV